MKADLQRFKNIVKKETDKKNLEKNFEEEIKSRDEEIAGIKAELQRFKSIIEEETNSRINFNKEMEKKSSHLESKMTSIMSSISKSDVGNELFTVKSEIKKFLSRQVRQS